MRGLLARAAKASVPPSASAADDEEESVYLQLVAAAWAATHGRGGLEPHTPPPPLGAAALREQVRVFLVEAGVADLPAGDAQRAVDALLQYELALKALIDAAELPRCSSLLALWRGDITTLRVGGIVNAANEGGLGCFQPQHRCIDNVIHCAAGPALRAACAAELQKMAGRLPTGEVMVTPAFNLPSDRVLHVPGPRGEHPEMLARCYRNVLEACRVHSIRSVAFCCISTGLFGYPAANAAEVAVATVRSWLGENSGALDVIVFNVFLESDFHIYKKLLDT